MDITSNIDACRTRGVKNARTSPTTTPTDTPAEDEGDDREEEVGEDVEHRAGDVGQVDLLFPDLDAAVDEVEDEVANVAVGVLVHDDAAVARGLQFTPDGALGAAFWIPAAIVPLLLVTHGYVFVLLRRAHLHRRMATA